MSDLQEEIWQLLLQRFVVAHNQKYSAQKVSL
jgi:hypothetical protein